jgi:hypothetical protein
MFDYTVTIAEAELRWVEKFIGIMEQTEDQHDQGRF